MRLSLLVVAAGALGVGLYAEDARACGGCFHPPAEQESVITDHRMIFAVSPTESTLYDQIHFQGSPQEFAWVLPIAGSVDVGVSADSVFTALDSLTAVGVQQPPTNCPGPPASCFQGEFGSATAGGADGGALAIPGVDVIKTQVVGPYETVQLHPTSNTDVAALEDYLTQHGFNISDDIKPVIAEYVRESFNFLAVRLQPGQGVTSMRPIRVTTQGANVALPLRMVAAGTGATVGIELWVVSTGRYQPTNFQSFAITNDDLTWDWSTNSSNYAALRAQKEAALPNAWEIESVVTTSPGQLVSAARNASLQNSYADGGVQGDNDYLPVLADGGTQTESPDQVQNDDYEALLSGLDPTTVANDYTSQFTITRMRADIAHAALNVDLTIGAAPDQSDLAQTRIPAHENGQPLCPVYNQCENTGQQLPRNQIPSSSSGGPDDDSSCRATSSGSSKAPTTALFALAAVAVGRAIRKRRRKAC